MKAFGFELRLVPFLCPQLCMIEALEWAAGSQI